MFLLKPLYPIHPHITLKSTIIKSPRLYFFDPCIAISALRINSYDLLSTTKMFISSKRTNIQDTGFFFEAQVIKHLRVYMNLLGARIFYYRDINRVEIDAIIELKNHYVAVEIKTGSLNGIADGIKRINKFREILTKEEREKYTTFCIVTASNWTYYDKQNDINVITLEQLFLDLKSIT